MASQLRQNLAEAWGDVRSDFKDDPVGTIMCGAELAFWLLLIAGVVQRLG